MLSWHMPHGPISSISFALSNLATYNYQNNALVSVFTHPVELDQLPSAPAPTSSFLLPLARRSCLFSSRGSIVQLESLLVPPTVAN